MICDKVTTQSTNNSKIKKLGTATLDLQTILIRKFMEYLFETHAWKLLNFDKIMVTL